MRFFWYKRIGILLALGVMGASPSLMAQETPGTPGLLVTPTRVVLEGKQRAAVISLANNGTAAGAYQLTLVNKRMDENGSLQDLPEGTEKLEGEGFASDFLRISPRRVTIGPGDYQSIRILARKPKDLLDGEYRSHLRFTVTPVNVAPTAPQGETGGDTLSIQIKANFGVTLPVIVRQGEVKATGSIAEASLYTPGKDKEEHPRPHLKFALERQGNRSLYGDLIVKYTKPDEREYVLKTMGGIAVYTPNAKRMFDIPLDVPDGVALDKGKVEIIYREKSKEGGEVIASHTVAL